MKRLVITCVCFFALVTSAHGITLEESRISANTSVAETSTSIFPNTIERTQELARSVVLTFSNTFGKALATSIGAEATENSILKSKVSSLETENSSQASKISTLESKVSKLESETKEQGLLIKAIEKLI